MKTNLIKITSVIVLFFLILTIGLLLFFNESNKQQIPSKEDLKIGTGLNFFSEISSKIIKIGPLKEEYDVIENPSIAEPETNYYNAENPDTEGSGITSNSSTIIETPSNDSSSESSSEPIFLYYESIEASRELLLEKFGVKEFTITYNTYSVYNDGSKVKHYHSSKENYVDNSGYNATDTDLYEYAIELVEENWSIYEELLEYVNSYRAEAGVAPVTLDKNICYLATMRSLEMDIAGYYSHRRADGRDWFIFDNSYIASPLTAENIAYGYPNTQKVSEAWYKSEAHYLNMIKASHHSVGFGYSDIFFCSRYCDEYQSNIENSRLWCQLFSDN